MHVQKRTHTTRAGATQSMTTFALRGRGVPRRRSVRRMRCAQQLIPPPSCKMGQTPSVPATRPAHQEHTCHSKATILRMWSALHALRVRTGAWNPATQPAFRACRARMAPTHHSRVQLRVRNAQTVCWAPMPALHCAHSGRSPDTAPQQQFLPARPPATQSACCAPACPKMQATTSAGACVSRAGQVTTTTHPYQQRACDAYPAQRDSTVHTLAGGRW